MTMADIIIYGMKMPISGAIFRVVEDLEGNKFLTSADCMNGLYYRIENAPTVIPESENEDA